MENFQEWGVGKPIGLVLFSRQVLLARNEVWQLLEWIRTGDGLQVLGPFPSVKRWVQMYRHPSRVMKYLVNNLFPAPGRELNTYGGYRLCSSEWSAFQRLSPEKRRGLLISISEDEWRESLEEAREFLGNVCQAQTNTESWAIPRRRPSDLRMRRIFRSPEIQFFLRVWFPCQVLYGEFSYVIHRRARQGDLVSLEKLLRLDKAADSDPRIKRHIADAWANNRAKYKRLMRALNQQPKKINRRQVKVGLASLVSKWARSCDEELTAPEIEALVHAAEKAKSGNLCDKDLPTAETLSKGIQRHREHWKMLPDKNSSKTVRSPK